MSADALGRMKCAAVLVALATCLGTHAVALETAQWPPPDATVERMKALQQALRNPEATAAQREAAREELSGLLKSPAGQAKGRTPDEKPARAARAAVDPVAVKPVPATPLPPPPAGVARVEVVEPPKPFVDPRTGAASAPSGQFAIDPRTGSVLHQVPGGFVDPKTGQFVPR